MIVGRNIQATIAVGYVQNYKLQLNYLLNYTE